MKESDRLVDSQHLQRDVIGPATLACQGDQGPACFLGRILDYRLLDFMIGERSPQSVGTQHQSIAGFQGDGMRRRVGGEFRASSQGGGKDVPLGMDLGFRGADHTILEEPAYIGMIAGYPAHLLLVHSVQPAVSNVAIKELLPYQNDRGGRSAHAAEFGVLGCKSHNLLMGFAKPGKELRLRVTFKLLSVNPLDGFDGNAAGLLPAFVTTHAVGHNRQSALTLKLCVIGWLPIGVAVFVILALAAQIAHAGRLNPCPYAHHTSPANSGVDLKHVSLAGTKGLGAASGQSWDYTGATQPSLLKVHEETRK